MSLFVSKLDFSKPYPKPKRRTGGCKPLNPFPVKLYKMIMHLAERGQDDIVSWGPGGASFLVHDTERLVSEALPTYFNQTKYKSFQRQLNFYGFERILEGPLEGSYWHPMFRRGQEQMCRNIDRKDQKQTKCKSSVPRMILGLQDIIIPRHTSEVAQDAELMKAPEPQQHKCSRISFENLSDMNMERIELEPASLMLQKSMFTLEPKPFPPHESILANGQHFYNFGKSFFVVENDLGELLSKHATI
ncbi:unnamed protein product [Cylindrotheca closterium]|uniref:HSF-type DNA-binding domain-containing protein n=1 Tax=Cylindrotheca closterium TaxID=2856 RepID=A0AAD2FT13_9STRA|nr:unnamed protein product [Cylindrotheca closterium]